MKNTRKLVSALVALGVFCGSTSALAQLQPPAPFEPSGPSSLPPRYPQGPATPGAPGAPGMGPTSGTVAQLNQSESEDSGRRLELVYVNLDVGGGFVSGTGGSGFFGVGGSAGVRLVSFTFGARVRDYISSGNVLLLNGEAAYHLVLGSADLVIGAHGGYLTAKGSGGGGNVGLDLGLDYYLSSAFSIGASVSPDLIFAGETAFGLFAGPRVGLHFGL